MINKITIISIITILLLGTMYNFIPEETDTHVCIIEGEITQSMYCDHLSSTAMTCYPKNDTTKGNKKCGTFWKSIDRTDVKNDIQEKHKGTIEICTANGCKDR